MPVPRAAATSATAGRPADRESRARATSGRSRRVWLMRVAAVMLPFAVLIVLEGLFRLAGWYAADGTEVGRQHVRYEAGTVFFPEWDRQIPSPRPRGTRRVFVLGGSATWGFGVEQPFGTLLEQRLQQQLPQHRWEVINGGVPAYGSHRVLEVARRACQFEPDVIVVYFGHNEFLEEIFFEANQRFAESVERRRFVRQFRLVRFLSDLARTDEASPPELRREFFGNTHFPLIRSEEQYRLRLEFLEANLRDLIACCRTHNTRLVIVPAVSNLLWPPGDSVHGPGYRSDPARWQRLFEQARQQFTAEHWHDAIETLATLEEIDPDFAESWYRHGLALLAIGEAERAEHALHQANLRDRRGDRVNPDVFESIVEVCRSESTLVLDLRRRFHGQLREEYERLRAGVSSALFLDHCHPSQAGHEIIADEVAAFLASGQNDR
ncbi:MAG TPA: GDSL-type esterase/lipase family protein [Planctomycetaceae bacterium]|nr:GDSL-type esterase/lipase family protein [Planctomycetaceae bacterium]